MIGVIIGGILGALTRYWFSKKALQIKGSAPYGTFFVNVVGSFLLGFIYVFLIEHEITSNFYNSIGVGFMGSFTTFSTFAVEGVTIFREQGAFRGILFSFFHTSICLVSCLLGICLAKILL